MPVRVLESQVWLPRPRDEVFAFFADAGNLESLTPPWLNFRILTPRPIAMAVGALIDYRIRLRGVPLRWRTLISAWEPCERFVDEQIRGPYRLWRHEHRFLEVDDGTLCTDRVEYRVPMDRLVHGWMVRPDLDRIFEFRRRYLLARFSAGPGQGSGDAARASTAHHALGGCADGALVRAPAAVPGA